MQYDINVEVRVSIPLDILGISEDAQETFWRDITIEADDSEDAYLEAENEINNIELPGEAVVYDYTIVSIELSIDEDANDYDEA